MEDLQGSHIDAVRYMLHLQYECTPHGKGGEVCADEGKRVRGSTNPPTVPLPNLGPSMRPDSDGPITDQRMKIQIETSWLDHHRNRTQLH